jgi:hypothetical protein
MDRRDPPAAPELVEAWRRILVEPEKSWVLFRHGTCVVLPQPEADLDAQAVKLMREWGPPHAGSPSGDFQTLTLKDHPGWVVTCHHKDILTYVAPEEMPAEKRDSLAVGLFGRWKRRDDSSELQVIHVEDRRKP